MNNDIHTIKAMAIEQTARKIDPAGYGTPVSCPNCGGALWRMKEGAQERYQCHLGHAFNAYRILLRHHKPLEETMWMALRTLEQCRHVLVTLAEEMAGRQPDKVNAYRERAEQLQVHIERIRQVITIFNEPDLETEREDLESPAGA